MECRHILCALGLALCIPTVSAAGEDTIQRIDREMPQIKRMVARYARAFKTPGVAVAIVTPEEVRFVSHGVREVGRPGTINSDTTFQLASCSKPMTSTLAAALVSRGVLDWNDRLPDLLPDFRFENLATTRRTTVGDMLSQRSGLAQENGDGLEQIGYGQKFILKQMALIDTTSDFGKYAYSNFGVTIGGVAAAAADHRSFNGALSRNLLRPLGMRGTFVPYSHLQRIRNRAVLHFTISGKSRPLFAMNADAQAPGGGVNTTARDIAKFLQLYLNDGRAAGRQLIDANILRQLYRPISPLGPDPIGAGAVKGRKYFYGLCWVVSPSRGNLPLQVTHSGGFTSGARTALTFWPDEKIGIAVLANNYPSLLPEAISEAFYQIYKSGSARAATFRRFRKGVKTAFNIDDFVRAYLNAEHTGAVINGLPLSAYAGTYWNDYTHGIILDERVDSSTGLHALYCTAGPHLPPLEVQKVKGENSLFVVTPVGALSKLIFSDVQNGSFQKMELASPSNAVWRTLTRVP